MYAPFFGLRQEPFSIAPDPRYLYMSERHREALAHLLYGLSCGGGFVLLTGEIGTGKTTVCRCFLEQVPANCHMAYIFNPKLTVVELLQTICDEFRIEVKLREGVAPTVKDYIDPLNAYLLKAHAEGHNCVLVIDEAQNLSADVLEQLRLLTNLETASRKLLQIVLIGQPELRDLLARPELEQLAQRVVARYHLQPLNEQETAQYVQHRLDVAGLDRPPPFERRAIRRIHRHARGIPRRINLLCDRAMLGAYAHSRGSIGPGTVDQAAREVFGRGADAADRTRRDWRPAWALAGLALAAGAYWAGTGAWRELRWEGLPGAPKQASAAASSTDEATVPVTSAPFTSETGKAPEKEAVAASDETVPPVKAPDVRPVAARAATTASPPTSTLTSTPAPAPAPASASPSRAPVLLKDIDAAWRELARGWDQALPVSGEPCGLLTERELRCFTGSTSLAMIRQLDRPGIVTLDTSTGQPSYALLVRLTRDSATLRAAGTEQTVTLGALAARWNGDYATLWRSPTAYTGTEDDLRRGSDTLAWVAGQLARGRPGEAAEIARSPATLRSRLRRFQTAQGLPVSGMLTPLTYMQLNRVAGVDEPRLQTPH